jgi:hypothetical protein
MKLSLVIAALVSVTLAVPSAGCFCEVPKCPLELIAVSSLGYAREGIQ